MIARSLTHSVMVIYRKACFLSFSRPAHTYDSYPLAIGTVPTTEVWDTGVCPESDVEDWPVLLLACNIRCF